MSEISEIRPAYPVTPIKRREENQTSHKDRRVPKSKQDESSPADDNDDEQPPHIDEYV